MRKIINTVIILCGLVLCGYVAFLAYGKNNRNGGAAKKPPVAEKSDPPKQVARVKVTVVKPQPMSEYLLLPGTLEAWEDIDLSAKVGGTVEWLGPQEGDRVTSGETILHLDAASRRALLNQVQAQLAQAEKQYERVSRLMADRVVTRAELDNATALRDVARANLEVARVGLDDATLRSPIDGVIDRIPVDQGEHVNAGQMVAKIVQTDRLKVLVNVPEKDVSFCKEGQLAGVFPGEMPLDQIASLVDVLEKNILFWKTGLLSGALPKDVPLDQITSGTIRYVALTADTIMRTYPMRVEIRNRNGKLRPGMIVRVGLIRQRIEKALAAPLYAVVDRGTHKVVFVEEKGRAAQRIIEPGIVDRERIQVTRGLKEGERLIVVGHRELADGVPVEVEGTVEP